MQVLLQDIRYSLRQFLKNPGFTMTALVSLALGIGATTAVFSVIYAALMNPYPYPHADRIVRLTMESKTGTDDWTNLNGPQIQQVRQFGIVESVLAMDFHAMTLTGPDVPENVNVVGLISNGFTDLGVPPVLGRGLLPSDAVDGADPQAVVVIGHKFWQKHFLANPDAVGKTLQLDRKDYLIVGVAAPRFTWYSADVYRPLKLSQDPARTNLVNLLLKPGVTHEQANAALQPVLEQFARDMPKHFPEHFKVRVEDLNAWVRRGISGTLYLLFGAVALLLAIGCGNVSILLLARGTARQRELAVRTAIGAQRRRIVRQLLTESLLLAIMGAGLGVAAAYGILAGMKAVLPRYAFAPEVVININLPVLLFCVGVALATGVLFGLGPALRLSRTRVGQMMQSNARRVLGSVHGRRTYDALIAGQIALTLLLLAGAGSAMEGFLRLLGHVFPVKWKSFQTAEGDIDTWTFDKDQAHATLNGGKTAEIKLKRFQGMTNEPAVLKNVKYWGTPRNDGFVMMPNELETYKEGAKAYEFKGTNGFMLTFDMTSKDLAPAKGSSMSY